MQGRGGYAKGRRHAEEMQKAKPPRTTAPPRIHRDPVLIFTSSTSILSQQSALIQGGRRY